MLGDAHPIGHWFLKYQGDDGVCISFYPQRCRVIYPELIIGGERSVRVCSTVGGAEIYEGELQAGFIAACRIKIVLRVNIVRLTTE
jgi:hypothetical protein